MHVEAVLVLPSKDEASYGLQIAGERQAARRGSGAAGTWRFRSVTRRPELMAGAQPPRVGRWSGEC